MMAPLALAAVVLFLAACDAAAPRLFAEATGERIRSLVTRVPDVGGHDVELAEYVLRPLDTPRDRGGALRLVLVADQSQAQHAVAGYAAEETPGGVQLYRVFRRGERLGAHFNFRMDVDDDTGRAVAGLPLVPTGAIR